MRNLFKWLFYLLACLIGEHDEVTTMRSYDLYKTKCTHCGSEFCRNDLDPRTSLPWDSHWEDLATENKWEAVND